ncbi:helix-turn-helix domain-containing protein [Nocardia sp. CA-290969]|uniref:helix-turn-helix domain-containing protein n=1 Tax=Nocardia sp. CA-290969 TaxID=3239986 RepID=UPI003D8C8846
MMNPRSWHSFWRAPGAGSGKWCQCAVALSADCVVTDHQLSALLASNWCPRLRFEVACTGRSLSRALPQWIWKRYRGITAGEFTNFLEAIFIGGAFARGGFHIPSIRLTKVMNMASGSTLPRRALGRQLRKLRERAELTQAAAARVAEVSPQSYGRMEDGRPTKVTDLALNALANTYEATDTERQLLLGLSREIR